MWISILNDLEMEELLNMRVQTYEFILHRTGSAALKTT